MPNQVSSTSVPQTMTPEALLSGIDNQANKTAFDTAAGLSARFVERLIQAGQIKNIRSAADVLQEGIKYIQPTLKQELVALSMKEIESYLPQIQHPIVESANQHI